MAQETEATPLNEKEETITEAEAAQYDRQIRLWGLDAQKRLRAAKALIVGVSGLGAEVAKNIVLSGIQSLLLLDDQKVTEEDFRSQFLVNRTDIGKNRAECSLQRTQLLNPMVEVSADPGSVKDKNEEFFKQFHLICVTECCREEMLRINKFCREHKILFYCGDVWGYYGYMFADLHEHEYAVEVPHHKRKHEGGGDTEPGEPPAKKEKTDETKTVKKEASFVDLKSALTKDWTNKSLKRTPHTFFIMQVLQKFRDVHHRDPSEETSESDKAELHKIRDQVLKDLNVSNKDIIPDSFSSYCFSELSPVCAIVGGVLGQEIIKAVSKKDDPHNNFFFYNGVDGSGIVDCIGNK